ncbi:hypothetical protein Tco_0815325 [Tanacetum coccineum]
METIRTFLKKFDHIPPEEEPMAFLLAKDKFLKIKQAIEEEQNQLEDIQELMLKLLNDLKICDGILLKQEEHAVQEEQEEQTTQSFLLNWNFPMVDDDEYTILYRSTKAITPDLPTKEPDNSLSMGDEHLRTISETESDKLIKSSVENLVPIPSESKGISDDIYDVPSCDNDYFDAEFGLINSLLSRDISITSPKIDFLPEEIAGELDHIDPILPGIDEDDFDEEEGAIALNLTPFIPFVLKYPSSSSILVVDSDFFIEELKFNDNESLSDEDVPEDNFKIYANPVFEFNDKYISNDVNPLFDEVLEDIECKESYDSNLDEPTLLVTPLSDSNEDECFDLGGKIDEIDAFLVMDISTDIKDGYHDPEGDIIYLESLLINNTIPNLPPEVFLDHDPMNLKDEHDNEDLKSMAKVFDPGIHEETFSPTYVSLSFEDRHYLSFTYVFAILSLNHFVEIPSGESKVHIEVLSVLWGNRLPIPDGSLPLSRYRIFRKGQKQSINGRNRARDWKNARKAKPNVDPIETKVDDWEFKGLFGVLLVDNVEEQRWKVESFAKE